MQLKQYNNFVVGHLRPAIKRQYIFQGRIRDPLNQEKQRRVLYVYKVAWENTPDCFQYLWIPVICSDTLVQRRKEGRYQNGGISLRVHWLSREGYSPFTGSADVPSTKVWGADVTTSPYLTTHSNREGIKDWCACKLIPFKYMLWTWVFWTSNASRQRFWRPQESLSNSMQFLWLLFIASRLPQCDTMCISLWSLKYTSGFQP